MSHPLPYAKVFAIDPGLTGGWAALSAAAGFIDVGDIPRFPKLINGVEFASIMRSFRPEAFVIEAVHSMPKQGLASTFSFGTSYGIAIGLATSFQTPISYVTPHAWKSHFRLSGKSKDAARELAIRVFPQAAEMLKLKKNGGRADALLMARYFIDREKGEKFV